MKNNLQHVVCLIFGLMIGAILIVESTQAAEKPLDLILVLDNSGSMKKNDPDFLVPLAIKQFIQQQKQQTQISVIIFDKNVNLSLPFIQVNDENANAFANSLNSINYKGLYTDSPAAIERAIYELKNYAREDSQKHIIFLTDGIVDTGKPEFDLEKTRWLRQELAADAAENDIRIYSIGFTDNADFQLIQSLAQQTQGEYYRAFDSSELDQAFAKINRDINVASTQQALVEKQDKPTENSKETTDSEIPSNDNQINTAEEPVENINDQPTVYIDQTQKPVESNYIDDVPHETPTIVAEDIKPITPQTEIPTRNNLPYFLLGLFLLIVGGLAYWYYLRSKNSHYSDELYISEAYLLDVHNHTNEKKYKLTDTVTMVGRVESSNNEKLNYIVIQESTIGRRHALIEYRDYAFWVVDQGSTNGTYVNDKLIDTATRLKDGDRVRFHKFEFVFEVPELHEDGITELSATILKQAVNERAKELPEPQFDITLDKSDLIDPEKNEAVTEFNLFQQSDDGFILDSEDETVLPEQVGELSLEPKTDTDPDKQS